MSLFKSWYRESDGATIGKMFTCVYILVSLQPSEQFSANQGLSPSPVTGLYRPMLNTYDF
jgi:hypothetical protein